jgi:hypothetical protein
MSSAAQFGEGSFDKGIFVNIPFDAMLVQLACRAPARIVLRVR